MAARPAIAGETLASSQWSPWGSQSSDATTSTGCTSPPKPAECAQTDIEADINTITAYLVKERAPEAERTNEGARRFVHTMDDVLREARIGQFALAKRLLFD